jgi:hypothetical protein
MYTAIMVFVIGLFVTLLFLNIYFRMKVIKVYKVLVKARVEFDTSHLLNLEKMEKEVIPNYPKYQNEIRTFIQNIRFSIKIAIILLLLISVLSAVLYYYQ